MLLSRAFVLNINNMFFGHFNTKVFFHRVYHFWGDRTDKSDKTAKLAVKIGMRLLYEIRGTEMQVAHTILTLIVGQQRTWPKSPLIPAGKKAPFMEVLLK